VGVAASLAVGVAAGGKLHNSSGIVQDPTPESDFPAETLGAQQAHTM